MNQTPVVNLHDALLSNCTDRWARTVTARRHYLKRCASIYLVLATLAVPAYGSDEDEHSCPLENLSPATFKVFSQNKDASKAHQLKVIDCYQELLDNATRNPEPRVTADIISLGAPRGVQFSEIYSEYLENLVLQNPQGLFDALLLVNKARVREVVTNLRDPLVKDKKDIDASINLLHEDPRFAPIVTQYLSEKKE